MAKSIFLKVEKYIIIGDDAGYHVQCGGVPVYTHSYSGQKGRLSGTGKCDPRTNAQRGVLWLKNNDMVREDARAEEGKPW